MSDLTDLKSERLRKLENLKSLGIDCYPSKINLNGEKVSSKQAALNLDENKNLENILLAGRIMTIRGQGKILFVDMSDEWGKFQIVLKEDILNAKHQLFFDNIDQGDFVAFSGNLFTTKRGEKSLEANDWQILTKSLLPLPSTFYGLENEEEKLRKRYLDFVLSPEKREVFYRKAMFWKTVRNFLEKRGFVEVETPTIETTTGGAEARPFKTFHNDFDMDVFMRISVGELWQKRLMAAGFTKTYEIGKVYRNEGSSPVHLQEFTNCEFYWAYADYKDGMKLVKDLYIEIAKAVYGKTKFSISNGNHNYEFDLNSEWKEIDYRSEILERTGVDILNATETDIKNKLIELGVKWEGDNLERLTDTIWKYCRKQISGPAFLINHPTLISPLAKVNPDNISAQVFQPIIAGAEAGKGYSELNDPQIQKQNFEQQQKLLEEGDEEAMMPDYEYVEMLEHGMPPTLGYGFGERLFAFFEGLTIRETQLFPLVKPKK